MSNIKKVIPKEDFKLEILLDNDSSVILNMKNRINSIRFGMLSDIEFFRCVTTDGKYVRWDDKIEMSINEVFKYLNN